MFDCFRSIGLGCRALDINTIRQSRESALSGIRYHGFDTFKLDWSIGIRLKNSFIGRAPDHRLHRAEFRAGFDFEPFAKLYKGALYKRRTVQQMLLL